MEENFNLHLGKKLRMKAITRFNPNKSRRSYKRNIQQIQKYEKNTNGVSANRLMQLSSYLSSITYFFEDFKNFNDIKDAQNDNDDLNYSFFKQTFFHYQKARKIKFYKFLKIQFH